MTLTPAEIEEISSRVAELVLEQIGTPTSQPSKRKYLSRDEAAQCLGVSLATLDRQIAAGHVHAKKYDRRVLIPSDQL